MKTHPISANVRHLLAVNDMKQSDLVKYYGFSSGTLHYVLYPPKNYTPSTKTVYRLCEIFDCTEDDLLKDATENHAILRNHADSYENVVKQHMDGDWRSMTPAEWYAKQNMARPAELMAENDNEDAPNENGVSPTVQHVAQNENNANLAKELLEVFTDLLSGTQTEALFDVFGRRVLAMLLNDFAKEE